MNHQRKQKLTCMAAKIIFGIFLFIFSVVGACLFSPASFSFAVSDSSMLNASHMNTETPHQDFTPIHPEGGFFAIDIVPNSIRNFLLATLAVFSFFIYKRYFPTPFLKRVGMPFLRRAEIHFSHSPYLFLFQDGVVHPKVF